MSNPDASRRCSPPPFLAKATAAPRAMSARSPRAVFLADDAVAALAVSLPAAEHSANDADALAARNTGAVASLSAALSHR
jgi:hypothetical protein